MSTKRAGDFWAALMLLGWRLPKGTKNATDEALESSGDACEKLSWVCGSVVVLGVLAEAVLAGLHLPYDSPWERWVAVIANAAVMLGVVGEVQFSMMAFRRDKELKRRSDDKVAAASARAAEAQLELERFRAPRSLSSEKLTWIGKKVRHFAGQKFLGAVSPGVGDAWILWGQIANSLQAANWVLISSGVSGGIQPPASISAVTRRGVHLLYSARTWVSSPFIGDRAKALADALTEMGIDAIAWPAHGDVVENNPDAIRIEIGPKP
jgi:hypothetical protein